MATDPAGAVPGSEAVPFSQCDIWERQKAFYSSQGIGAWADKVPFYATSNPYIAHAYASVVIRFLQEYAAGSGYRRLEPFYIVELGAGSGTFGFYLVKRLVELQEALHLTQVPFVYVMTDFVAANVEFWRRHPALQPYVARGVLDFAVCDLEADQELRLLGSGAVLRKPARPEEAGNPLIVVANYVFDVLPQDLFRIDGGRLQAGLTQPTGYAGGPQPPAPVFNYQDIELPYYTGPGGADLDALLTSYAKRAGDGNLLLPVGALRCLHRLIELGGERLLLLATDKGYARHFELYRPYEPEIVCHDTSFSLMVNFHAIGQYFQQRGGSCGHQSTQQSIVTSVCAVGQDLAQLRETKLAIAEALQSLSPGNLLAVCGHLEQTRSAFTLESFVAALSLLRWDPRLLNTCGDMLPSLLRSASASAVADLLDALREVAENFYFIPGGVDTLAQIGALCHELKEYGPALEYYHRSIAYFGNVDTTLLNMALCHEALGETDRALALLHAAVEVNPDYVLARGWIAQLQAGRR